MKNIIDKYTNEFMDDAKLKAMMNKVEAEMKYQEEKWNKMTRIEKIKASVKLNVDIVKAKHMTIKEKVSLIVLGA